MTRACGVSPDAGRGQRGMPYPPHPAADVDASAFRVGEQVRARGPSIGQLAQVTGQEPGDGHATAPPVLRGALAQPAIAQQRDRPGDVDAARPVADVADAKGGELAVAEPRVG